MLAPTVLVAGADAVGVVVDELLALLVAVEVGAAAAVEAGAVWDVVAVADDVSPVLLGVAEAAAGFAGSAEAVGA